MKNGWAAICGWLRRILALKHDYIAHSFFAFFRGTFYRWAQLWPEVCAPLANAPEVVAVGDLHVENFGTWRDPEGRLVWGINDFDEAFPMACTNDLTRLLASVQIACPEGHLKIEGEAASEIVLGGYRKGLQAGGKPFVLAEEQTPLREMARDRLRDPEKFWRHLEKQRKVKSVPRSARKALLSALPESGSKCGLRIGWPASAVWGTNDTLPLRCTTEDESRAKPSPARLRPVYGPVNAAKRITTGA